jgi:pimeloyl-ACP methyl ester carboxylesterase
MQRTGAGMKPTLVLLHASASSARQWDALAPALALHFDVHAIDLHGHGMRAPWPADAPLSLGDEAALIEPLFERSGRLHLVGHSYGGAVAIEAARRHPRAVKSLVIFEPVLFGLLLGDSCSHAEAQQVSALAATLHAFIAQERPHAAAERFVDFWSGAGTWARLPAPRQAAVAQRMPSVVRHFDAVFAAADPRPALAHQAPPMLCLAGADTVAATRRIAQLLEDALPQAEHATLPAMGHMGPLADAVTVNTRITDFLLRQVDPARPPAAVLCPATTTE